MSLQLRFWGTRGSIPTPGPHTVRYGGNTPCVEVRTDDGRLVILDAGHGHPRARPLADRRARTATPIARRHLPHPRALGSHPGHPVLRADLPAGQPLHDLGLDDRSQTSIDRVVRDQMSPVVFPVTFEELQAHGSTSASSPRSGAAGNGYRGVGLRGAAPGRRAGVPVHRRRQRRVAGARLHLGQRAESARELRRRDRLAATGWSTSCAARRVLVHDAMYTADEYERLRGWGHSTYEDAVALALDAGVERLVLFHHRPSARTTKWIGAWTAAGRSCASAGHRWT